MKTELDYSKADAVLLKYGTSRDACIPVLQAVQAEYGYLPPEILKYIAERSDLSERQIYGVATFYEQFRFEPVGKHIIRVCHGTACHVNGAQAISSAVEGELGIKDGETTKDGLFTLESVACLGCCSLAPVMMIDDTVHGRLTPAETRKILRSYSAKAEKK